MPTVGALEFQRKFGEYQHRAQREPVEITRHGRREFVLMSAEHYDWLRTKCTDIARLIEVGMESWPKNDNHALCSEKWCPAWANCKGKSGITF